MRSSLLLLTLLLPALAHAQALPLTLTNPDPELFGAYGDAVSSMPDADGDGRSDLVVGNPGADPGRAYLFSGAAGALLRTLQSPNPDQSGSFGKAVSGVADADGDGRGDLLVGDPGEFGDAEGRAYLFSGATSALLRALISPNPEVSGLFGASVSGVPDADGDGRGDLLVGAEGEDSGALNGRTGRAYLYSGATGALLRTLESPNPGEFGRFGFSVSGVADTDGDDAGDLLIGIDGNNAYLFSGATGARLHSLQSPSARSNYFGYSVSGVPDTDDDGAGDLLIGSYEEDGGANRAGRAYLFSGASGALIRILRSPDPEANGDFGISVSGVADADGDGDGDLLIGATGEGAGGRAYLFSSGSGGISLSASGNPTTILPGGAVTVTATVTNTTAQPAPLDLWLVVTRDDTAVLTRRLGSGRLPAGATVTRSFDLTAPGNTPPGTYTLNVNVGDFPSTVLASDAFDVTVTGARPAGASVSEPFVVDMVSGDVFAADGFASPPAAASSSSSVVVSPNPFSGQTALRFALADVQHVRLSIHDALGREVALLVDSNLGDGPHTAVFDGRGLTSGVYVWRLASGRSVQTGRITRLE